MGYPNTIYGRDRQRRKNEAQLSVADIKEQALASMQTLGLAAANQESKENEWRESLCYAMRS
jgi:hypothetical protein